MSNQPHFAVGAAATSTARPQIRISALGSESSLPHEQLRRLTPPPTPPSGGQKLTSASEYDRRDTIWIADELGAVLSGLDASRVACYAVVGKQASPIKSEVIPSSAQLVIAHGPLRHDAGITLTIKSAQHQRTLFSGELRYPIDLDPDGTVLLLLASPHEEGNEAIGSPQIYTGRIVSLEVEQELRQHIRRELHIGGELLRPISAT